MPRSYRHIQQYEKEIIELFEKGKTLREIGEQFGFTHKQMRDFKTRYNIKQKKIEAGIAIKKKGRRALCYYIPFYMLPFKTAFYSASLSKII